nr:hypothetical protein [Granulosicoccus sp.]
MNKLRLSNGLAVAGVLVLSASVLAGGPSSDKLVIDEELEMTTRAAPPEGHPLTEVISGWHYRTPETRALETDTFQNPGLLGVEQGEVLWNTVDGAAGKSCASCHDDATVSMKGVGAHYPKWDEKTGRPMNIELRINQCRVDNMKAEPYPFDKGGQK